MKHVLGMTLGGLAFLTMACAAEQPPAPLPTPKASAPRVSPAPPATRTLTTLATRAPIAPGAPITLTVWTTEEWAIGATPAGRVLQDHLDAFRKTSPDISATFVLKKPTGKGGLLDALKTTHELVPARLPDLVTLDLKELAIAADAQLIQPLSDSSAPELQDHLFPFALERARVNGAWVGVPFSADAQQLAATTTPPRNWDEFTRQKGAFLAPWGGDDAFLAQYVALGAATGEALDVSAAAQALGFLKRGRDLQIIPDSAINTLTSDEAWSGLVNGHVAMAQVWATRAMNERAKVPLARAASIPTRDARIVALANGWAFAIVTDDPARRNAAARWIAWLVEKERLGAWMRAAQRLPATRNALAAAVDSPERGAFLQNLLENATLASLTPTQSQALRLAVTAIWKGQLTPEEAARNYLATK